MTTCEGETLTESVRKPQPRMSAAATALGREDVNQVLLVASASDASAIRGDGVGLGLELVLERVELRRLARTVREGLC